MLFRSLSLWPHLFFLTLLLPLLSTSPHPLPSLPPPSLLPPLRGPLWCDHSSFVDHTLTTHKLLTTVTRPAPTAQCQAMTAEETLGHWTPSGRTGGEGGGGLRAVISISSHVSQESQTHIHTHIQTQMGQTALQCV